MEIFFLKLAVAVTPLILLVSFVSMERSFKRPILTALLVLTLLITATATLTQRAERLQIASLDRQSALQPPASAYNELVNGMTFGGR